jgi:hypothetical protein
MCTNSKDDGFGQMELQSVNLECEHSSLETLHMYLSNPTIIKVVVSCRSFAELLQVAGRVIG